MFNETGKYYLPHSIRKYNLKISIRQFSANIHTNKKSISSQEILNSSAKLLKLVDKSKSKTSNLTRLTKESTRKIFDIGNTFRF